MELSKPLGELLRHLVPRKPSSSKCLWYCTVAPVDLFTQDRNCTEGWLGPMWSSPSRYFDTCNLTFGPLVLVPQESLSGLNLHKRHRGSLLSIFNRVWVWIAIGKTSSVFVGRRCHCLLSTRGGIEGAWGPIRSSPHASVNTLGCLICLQLSKVL